MNLYSKNTRSRSVDLTDLLSFSQNSKVDGNSTNPNHTHKTKETKQTKTHKSPSDAEEDEAEVRAHGERFGMKLSRNCSLSSSSSYRFSFDKQSTKALQSAVKRAFSMRSSSSVCESRYCRIHDQSVTQTSPLYDDVEVEGMDINTEMQTRSVKMIKKRKKNGSSMILRACKRIFGL